MNKRIENEATMVIRPTRLLLPRVSAEIGYRTEINNVKRMLLEEVNMSRDIMSSF